MIKNCTPGYVVNIPMRIYSDSEGDTSSGEEKDGTFPENCFSLPQNYFRLCPKNKKKEPKAFLATNNAPGSVKSDKLAKCIDQGKQLFKQFETQAFGRGEEYSQRIGKNRLRVVVGANKMRSISKSRNQGLQKAVDQLNNNSPDNIKTFGFFWDGHFEKATTNEEDWIPAPYEEVQKFYRQLKKAKPNTALRFRKALEGSRAHQIPYCSNRERISKHEFTARYVGDLRRKNKITDVYLGVFDADSISLRAKNRQGVFTHYDKLIRNNLSKNKVPLEMGSCGYRFTGQSTASDTKDPIMEVGSELDLWTRHMTAIFFGYGVYYSEPSIVIRIPPGFSSIPYSFTPLGSNPNNQRNESLVILKQVRDRFDGSQDVVGIRAQGAIPSATPERTEKTFAAHYDKVKKIVRWSYRDLKRLRGLSQTHFRSRTWAENLLRDLTINETIIFNTPLRYIHLKNKKTIRLLMISLISRLFNHYDVISIAKDELEKKKDQDGVSFPKEFIQILETYNPNLRPLQPTNKTRNHKERDLRETFNYIDQITSLDRLEKALELFISPYEVSQIKKAAKAVSKKALNLFRSRFVLDFPKLSLELMQGYISSLTLTKYKNFKTNALNNSVLHNEVLNDQEKLDVNFKKKLINAKKSDQQDTYQATPLHWAAITGNHILVEKLFEAGDKKGLWFFNIQAKTLGGATPLHCALRYCTDNANDMKLLERLINDKNADQSTDNGVIPLTQALNDLENPAPVVKLICKHSKLPTKYKKPLVELLESLHSAEREEVMLLTLLYHLPKGDLNLKESVALIKSLIKRGLKVDGKGYILPTHNLENDFGVSRKSLIEKELASPIVLAAKTGDLTLVQLMLDKGVEQLTGVYDEEGNTPLTAVIKAASNDCPKLIPMLRLLRNNGADSWEENTDNNDGSALHVTLYQRPFRGDVFEMLLENNGLHRDYVGLLTEALNNNNSEAVNTLCNHVDLDQLSRITTQRIRHLTGRRDVYNDKDIKFQMKKNRIRAQRNLSNQFSLGDNLWPEARTMIRHDPSLQETIWANALRDNPKLVKFRGYSSEDVSDSESSEYSDSEESSETSESSSEEDFHMTLLREQDENNIDSASSSSDDEDCSIDDYSTDTSSTSSTDIESEISDD